jgi:hypothetical protein
MSKTIIGEQDDFLKAFLEQEENKEDKKPEDKKVDDKKSSNEDDDFVKLFEKQLNESDEYQNKPEDKDSKKKENESKEDDKSKEEVEDTNKSEDELKPEDKEKDEYNFKAIASYLAEEGAIDFEDSEDIENTPEVIREAVVKTAQNMVSEYKESLPDVVQDLVDYIEKGGKPEKYLQSLQREIDLDKVDLEEAKDQKLVISEYLKLQGLSLEEIEETIKDFEDGIMLDKQSKIASKQLKKYYDGRTNQLVEEQKEYEKQLIANQNKEIEDIKKEIKSSKEIAGLPISDSQKEAFIKYLLAVDKSGKTSYQKETEIDPVKIAIELAWVKFNKYDWSKATKQAKKEVTENLKQMFKKSETTIKGKTNEPPAKQKADDFGSFGKFFGKTNI